MTEKILDRFGEIVSAFGFLVQDETGRQHGLDGEPGSGGLCFTEMRRVKRELVKEGHIVKVKAVTPGQAVRGY